MTTEEAMKDACDGLTDEQLAKFRMTREEWVGMLYYLAGMGIYPDKDPRNEGKYESQ